MPFDRSLYADDWEDISAYIRFKRAGGLCEGSPVYPDCKAVHGDPHPHTGSEVVLTTAHLDHDTTNDASENLRAMCQRCHLTYDAAHHAKNVAETRRRKQIARGQMEIIWWIT